MICYKGIHRLDQSSHLSLFKEIASFMSWEQRVYPTCRRHGPKIETGVFQSVHAQSQSANKGAKANFRTTDKIGLDKEQNAAEEVRRLGGRLM